MKSGACDAKGRGPMKRCTNCCFYVDYSLSADRLGHDWAEFKRCSHNRWDSRIPDTDVDLELSRNRKRCPDYVSNEEAKSIEQGLVVLDERASARIDRRERSRVRAAWTSVFVAAVGLVWGLSHCSG